MNTNFNYLPTIGEAITVGIMPIVYGLSISLIKHLSSSILFFKILNNYIGHRFLGFITIFTTFTIIKVFNISKKNGCESRWDNNEEWLNIFNQSLLIQVAIIIIIFFVLGPFKKLDSIIAVQSLWALSFYLIYWVTMMVNTGQLYKYCNSNMYNNIDMGSGIIPIMYVISIIILGVQFMTNKSENITPNDFNINNPV